MISYLAQWVRNRVWKPVLPLELILFVTGRCTFRCKHCFIEKFDRHSSKDPPLDVIDRLASDLPNLVVLMITGGEPFLRNDIPEIVRLFSVNSCPWTISIATNGFLTEKIVGTVEQILNLPDFHNQLVVTISFEGTEEDHDNNRGCAGSYEKGIASAKELKNLQASYSKLELGANLTLIPGNEKSILHAAHELSDMNLFSFLSQNIYRDGRPCNACRKIDTRVYQQLSKFVQDYSQSICSNRNSFLGKWHHFKEHCQADLIARTCYSNAYQGVPCEAGRGIGVVYSDGRVAPCELMLADWGNIKEQSFSEIWNIPANRKSSDQLRRNRCFCTHECFISASLNLQLGSILSCIGCNLIRRLTRFRRIHCMI